MAAEAPIRRFFKVFFPDVHAHQLELAPGFQNHAKDLTLGSVSLVGPSGNTWKVLLVELNGKLFFTKGWGDFVRDHDLKVAEFLVFEYTGDCCFDVLVLDYSGCEKESAFQSSPSGGYCGDGALMKRSFEVIRRTVGDEEKGKKKRGRKPLVAPTVSKGSNAKIVTRGKRVVLSQRRPVQRVEIERIEAEALAFKSTNPFLTMAMRKSFVYTGYMLNIPYTFARTYLPTEGGSMTLIDPMGKPWQVTYVCRNGYFFSAGWRKFSIANHLEEDDICIFELIEPRIISVHIFRVVEELTPMILKSLKYIEVKEAVCEPNGTIIRR